MCQDGILSRLVWFKMEKQRQGQVNPDLFGHFKQAGADEASARKDISPQNISSGTATADKHVTNTATKAHALDASTLSRTELL